MKESRTEERINARLRELAEEARNLRRDLEQAGDFRVPPARAQANDSPPKTRKNQ